MRAPRAFGSLLVGVWVVLAGQIRAAEVDLALTTTGQLYQTRTAAGDLLDRRRVSQWVDLRAARLLGVESLDFQLGFRIQAELGFGDVLGEHPGHRAELMLAVVRWRKLGGRLDLELGRQWLVDELDFILFDGLRADLQLPAHLVMRLVGGFRVRDRSWLGGGSLELSGVEDAHVPAPVAGAGLELRLDSIVAGVDYRRTVLWTDGWPLDEELVAASFSARLWRRSLGFDGGACFDLLQDDWSRLRADGFYRLPSPFDGVRLEAGWLRSVPRYALDSIFHFFSPAPFDEVRAGVRWSRRPAWSLSAAYTHRAYRRPPEGGGDGAGWRVHGVDLRGQMRIGEGLQGVVFAAYEDGAVGRRWLVAPSASWEMAEDRWFLDGRAIVSHFQDPVQDNLRAVTVGCSAGLTWRFAERHAVMMMAELNSNRFHPARLRLFGVLDLAFQFGPARYFP